MRFIHEGHGEEGGVYRIRSLVTGRVYYGVARGFSARWRVHKSELTRGMHVNWKLQREFNVYGSDSLEFTVVCVDNDAASRVIAEESLIASVNQADSMNIKPRSGVHSDETRAKIAASKTGKPRPRDVVERITAKLRGRKVVNRKPVSDETRAKLSAAHIGKPHSEEWKAKASARRLGDPHLHEQMARARKGVRRGMA